MVVYVAQKKSDRINYSSHQVQNDSQTFMNKSDV